MGIIKDKSIIKEGFRTCENKGFHIKFPNGWTVSVQFGQGNYCENYTLDYGNVIDFYEKKPDLESINAEVWCWSENKENYPKEPLAHQTAKDILKILNKVSKFGKVKKQT